MTDHLTILTSRGPRLAKRWTTDGIQGYERAKHFTVERLPLGDIRDLRGILGHLELAPTCCVIRGAPVNAGLQEDEIVTRDLDTFKEEPHHWVCLDVDNHELPDGYDLVIDPDGAVEHFVINRLPREFQGVSYHWQLSNSAGHGENGERRLKAHLWFWLAEKRTGAELERWARVNKVPVDITVFRTVQVHYTAAPTVDDGVFCPIVERSGFHEGVLGEEVLLDIPEETETERTVRAGRLEMVDPTEKPGLVGLFCRLYPPARAIDELLGGHFEWEGDSDTRLTWLHGGGSPGGAVITDDELHVYNSHSSDPLEGRAANVWDLCRVHLFGDQDPDGGAAALGGDIRALPSDKAMREFVKGLDDVRAELHTLRRTAAEEWDEFHDEPDPEAEAKAARRQAADAAWRQGRLEHLRILTEGISGCQDVETLKAFCSGTIAGDEDIDAADRDGILRPAVQQRWSDLTGNRLKADLARRMVEPSRAPSNAGGNGPDWLERWAYATDLDKFFSHDTKSLVSGRGFDAMHTLRMPLAQDNVHRERASDWAVNVWGIETVDNVIYAPGKGEVFEALGRRWANTYREDSVPVAAVGDGAVVGMVQAHLKRLFPDDRERGLLVSWLAHQVQHPGVKVRWAPYIFGAEGTGKTFLAELLGWAMGDVNVRVLSGGTLKSDFTGWSAGAAVVVIEEVYQPGHVFDTEEKLKAPIANDTVDVHRKGKDSFAAPNFTNYLLLSNHADGMPVGEGNRRLFFVQVAIGKAEAKALDAEGYYVHLFDACRAAKGELRAWLLGVPLAADFDPNGRAPETAARADVIELSRSEPERVLRDAVGGALAFTTDWARGVLKAAGLEPPANRQWTRIATAMGFDPVTRRIRRGGERIRIYRHESLRDSPDDVVVAHLTRSVPTDFDGMDSE